MSLLFPIMLPDRFENTRPGSTTSSPQGARIAGQPTVVETDVPCKLDRANIQAETNNPGIRASGRLVVYMKSNVDVKTGDFVKITRSDGSIVDKYKVVEVFLGELFNATHYEVSIEPTGGAPNA